MNLFSQLFISNAIWYQKNEKILSTSSKQWFSQCCLNKTKSFLSLKTPPTWTVLAKSNPRVKNVNQNPKRQSEKCSQRAIKGEHGAYRSYLVRSLLWGPSIFLTPTVFLSLQTTSSDTQWLLERERGRERERETTKVEQQQQFHFISFRSVKLWKECGFHRESQSHHHSDFSFSFFPFLSGPQKVTHCIQHSFTLLSPKIFAFFFISAQKNRMPSKW